MLRHCRVWRLAALALVATGCHANNPVPAPADDAGRGSMSATDADAPTTEADTGDYPFPCLGLGEREPSGKAAFADIYLDVFCKLGCTDGYCHGVRGAWGGLTMTSIEGAYAALIDQPAGGQEPVDGRDTCRDSGLKRVEPGAPERSLLYLKVTGRAPCGAPMPPPDSRPVALSAAEQEQVRRWIAEGAPLDAP